MRHQNLQWISSFLNNQIQLVNCNGFQSISVDVVSGVPQGTILGPLLFLIYINDLPEFVPSSCGLFADDCLLYSRIECLNDCKILQDDLSRLEEWVDGLQ